MDLADWLALGLLFAIVIIMIQATVILHFTHLAHDLAELLHLPGGPKVERLAILFPENAMATITEGTTQSFVVQGFNKKGNPVALTDVAVTTSDHAIATATVNADGTGGVLTALAPGAADLGAAAAGKSVVESVRVIGDNVVDSVKIVFGNT